MRAGRVAYLGAALVALLGAAWLLRPTAPEQAPVKRAMQITSIAHSADRRPAPAPSPAPGSHTAQLSPAKQLRREWSDTHDLKALYDRFRLLPDPTGEISFVLAGIAAECGDFAGKSFESSLKQYQDGARRADHYDESKRSSELKRRIERCDGFESNVPEPKVRASDTQLIYTEMHKKALDAGYPGAVARALSSNARGQNPLLDEMSIHYLSEKADGDVIVGLGSYIINRIVPVDGRRGPSHEREIWRVAWIFVGCDFGADCGTDSRLFYMTCVTRAACGLTRIDDVLRIQGVSDETLATAYTLSTRLSAGIRNRDWRLLGF